MLRQDSIHCEQCQKNTLHRLETLSTGVWSMLFLGLFSVMAVSFAAFSLQESLLYDWIGSTAGILLAGGVIAFTVHHLAILPFLKWHCQICGNADS